MTSALQDNVIADVTYSSGYNARAVSSQPSIDRARGGIIKIKLVWPAYTGNDSRGDRFTVPKRVCEFEIDLEQLPLVDTSGYEVQERQTGPDEMPYPYGATVPFPGTFA